MPAEALLEHLEAFTSFVRRRTNNPELAADIVQDCLLKAIRSDNIPVDTEGAITWFYRVLRNAIIDAHRRKQTRDKTVETLIQEMPETASPDAAREVCHCVLGLLKDLPAADAELLRRVDLEGEPVSQVAETLNTRANTMHVRLLRARRRLREQVERTCRACAKHGCADCDCG